MGGVSRTYPDSWFFLSLIFKDGDMDSVLGSLYRMRNGPFEVVVPQIVVGEVVTKILDRVPDPGGRTECLEKFHGTLSDLDVTPHTCMPNISEEICRVMSDLRRIDRGISRNDSAVFGHAVVDPDAKILLTQDKALIYNDGIKEYERKRRSEEKRNTALLIKGSV